MEKIYVETDKNGTKIYHDWTCPRCGGLGGGDQWRFTGWTCYKCRGTGKSEKPAVIKVYTPEYRAKLDEIAAKKAENKRKKKIAERMEKAPQEDREFLDKNFFGADSIYIIKGNTYDIKEELKSEGCKFMNGIGWYAKDTLRPAWKMNVDELTEINVFGVHQWIANENLLSIKKNLVNSELKESNWQFEIGQRVEIKLNVKASIRVEGGMRFSYRDDGISYINKMEDENGNDFVWKTSSPIGGEVILKGTIKEHTEYNGRKQTVLTRCKVL